MQQWEAFAPQYARPLAAGYFYGHIPDMLNGLANPTRQTAFRHLASGVCVVCQTPCDLGHTEGDHIIPRHTGGSNSVQNTLLLCRRHNSSKGVKDLLAWWLEKDYGVD